MPVIKPFEDFKLHKAADEAVIKKYENILHKDIINIWKEYGFGSFAKGFLKTINPDEYQELLNETYICGENPIPILTTGLGDILTLRETYEILGVKHFDIDILFYRDGDNSLVCTDRYFLKRLTDTNFYKNDFYWEDYLRAVKKYGATPEYDECYGYKPYTVGHLENMGKVKNLKIVKIKEYIMQVKEKIGAIKYRNLKEGETNASN